MNHYWTKPQGEDKERCICGYSPQGQEHIDDHVKLLTASAEGREMSVLNEPWFKAFKLASARGDFLRNASDDNVERAFKAGFEFDRTTYSADVSCRFCGGKGEALITHFKKGYAADEWEKCLTCKPVVASTAVVHEMTQTEVDDVAGDIERLTKERDALKAEVARLQDEIKSLAWSDSKFRKWASHDSFLLERRILELQEKCAKLGDDSENKRADWRRPSQYDETGEK